APRDDRLSGARGSFAAQDDMRGLLRTGELNTFVSERLRIDAFEQPLSTTEQDRCNGDVQLIDQAFAKILLDRVRPAADAHVQSAGRLACTGERLANAAGDEVERRAAFHVERRTRMMGQDEDRKVIRRIAPPPALPARVRPWAANGPE